ncbi:MAG: S-methyl-5'-thioadenosine phosphorylase [Planctomycetota bacterium]
MQKLGVIGGSGLYEIGGLRDIEEVDLETPFGPPSDRYTTGRLEDVGLVFLPRHGRGHRLMPTELPFRANIHGMKELGVDCILALSAVGSMREDIAPGDLVIIDQFIDRTRQRTEETFFGDGIVAHVHFADPVCAALAGIAHEAASLAGATVHRGGTYLCMEGPQFSTRAESRLYRSWGVEVIGMTNLQEAKLAREAGICYSTIALATDYDCWHQSEEDVSVEAVLEVLRGNADMARQVIANAAGLLGGKSDCHCADSLELAILTARDAAPPEAIERLRLLLPESWLAKR